MIAFRGLAKSYGRHRALDGLTLTIERGEVVALLGPNGSGKTTALKAAAGLIHPSAGEVLLGDPPRPAGDPAAREILSFLPQKVSFPDTLTGREVVEFHRRLRNAPPERVGQALAFAALNGAADRTVGTFSGGMVQRLGLAVAVVPDAPVFLLDEPTAALDPEGLSAFHDFVQQGKARGRTVLFTSHQLGDVEHLADRFAVLLEGRLAASLSSRELRDRLADRGVMRVRIDRSDQGALGAVRRIAPQARFQGDDIVVPGAAARRPAVLDALRSSCVEVLSLTVEEGRLEDVYRDLVGGKRA